MVAVSPRLGPYLERLSVRYGAGFLDTDPLGEVRRFTRPDDLEVAGFLAAGLAFGRVDLIRRNVRDLGDRLDGAPGAVAEGWSPRDRRRLRKFVHRWVRAEDLEAVLIALGRARRRHGSLRTLFAAGYEPGDPHLGPALARFLDGLAAELPRRRGPVPLGVRTFFADPRRGGACKRLNLFLRWMIRPDDGVDLGLWPEARPDQLVIPLDTHVSRISRYLGLSSRRTVDWKMAVEITDALRGVDARDPVRFDFALARLGILDRCPRRVNRATCRVCDLVPVCTLGRERG